jgi:hypothetical protein
MAFSIYTYCNLGYSESELLEVISTAKTASLASGGLIPSSVATGDLNTTFDTAKSATHFEQIRAARMALHVLMPGTYPPVVINESVGLAR